MTCNLEWTGSLHLFSCASPAPCSCVPADRPPADPDVPRAVRGPRPAAVLPPLPLSSFRAAGLLLLLSFSCCRHFLVLGTQPTRPTHLLSCCCPLLIFGLLLLLASSRAAGLPSCHRPPLLLPASSWFRPPPPAGLLSCSTPNPLARLTPHSGSHGLPSSTMALIASGVRVFQRKAAADRAARPDRFLRGQGGGGSSLQPTAAVGIMHRGCSCKPWLPDLAGGKGLRQLRVCLHSDRQGESTHCIAAAWRRPNQPTGAVNRTASSSL